MIRVLVVTDLPLFRYGIRSTLERAGDCIVVGESTDMIEIIDLVRTEHPDVVLLDGGLTSLDPCEMARLLHQHASRNGAMFIFAPSEDEEFLFRFIKLGAVAYETRTITPQELVEKVRRVNNGEYLITSDVLLKLPRPYYTFEALNELEVKDHELVVTTCPLSSREVEILEHIAGGNSNKEIAKTLGISDQTVKNHITSILKKLDVNDRTAAVVHALRNKWISLLDV